MRLFVGLGSVVVWTLVSVACDRVDYQQSRSSTTPEEHEAAELRGGGSNASTSTAPAVSISPKPIEPEQPEQPQHRIFVTSQSFRGNLGGLAGADDQCHMIAMSRGLGGVWRALLSSYTSAARKRINIYGPVANLKGEIIARDGNDLWDATLAQAVRYNEMGQAVGAFAAWTGSEWDGDSHPHGANGDCYFWTEDATLNTTRTASTGEADQANWLWMQSNLVSCAQARRLYCISQREDGVPDLVVTDMYTAKVANTTVFYTVYKNQGTGIGRGSFLMRYTYAPQGIATTTSFRIEMPLPGETRTLGYRPLSEASHVTATIDADNRVVESNEGNNSLTKTLAPLP